ncbi:hypothetical protein Tco_0139347 [Tanacetum coccineum]
MLDRIKLTMTLDDFRTIFQLPQATDNNHECFIAAPKFSEMVPFFLNDLCFTLELRSPSNFKTTGLVQPWQTLCKKNSRCLTTRVTGYDQPPSQIMQMLYCFVNNMHVDYADLLWEGLHYLLEHPSTPIPYLRFTKLIISHYMTTYPEISRRVCDKYHNLEHDETVESIFNSGKNKVGVGIKIPSWTITDEMKRTKHYRMTTNALRTPNPDVNDGESSAQQKSTVIRLRIPSRRSTRLTSPTPILTTTEAEDIILQDTIQLSIAEQKSYDEFKAKQNVEKVKEHLIAEEIEKLIDGSENVENDEIDNSISNSLNNPGTRIEPRSHKESPYVEINDVVQPVNVIKEDEESVEDDYELKRREKRKHVEETRNKPSHTTTRYPWIHSTLMSSDTKKLQELTVTDPTPLFSTPSSSSSKLSATQRLVSLFKPKTGHIMEESLPKMVDDRVKELTKKQVSLYVVDGLIMERKQSQANVAKMIADAIQQEHENLRAEISSQINNVITNHIPS